MTGLLTDDDDDVFAGCFRPVFWHATLFLPLNGLEHISALVPLLTKSSSTLSRQAQNVSVPAVFFSR
jgi:hypothetical protein